MWCVSDDKMRALMMVLAGTRFQATGNQDEEKDVVAEHEDKADSVGDPDCLNSHHSVIHLWWLQMLMWTWDLFD